MNTTHQQDLIKVYSSAPIVKLYGTTVSFDEQGHAHLHLPYNPNLDRAHGGIDGSPIATLLDNAGWFAVAAQKESILITTSEFRIHYLRYAQECALHAEGWVVKAGKRISVAEMRVSIADGELIAIGTGTFVAL